MTRSSNTKVFTPFANPERKFQSRKDIMPIAVHNIYSFYESESLESESKDLSDIDIETLTLGQYMALNRNNSHVGVKRPEIEKSIFFEIKSQLLRELRENTFSGGKTEDAMEHLRKILEIVSLFNTPGISGNDIMLQNFPLLLQELPRESLLLNLDNLEKQLDGEEFQEIKSIEYTRTEIQQFRDTLIQHMESVKKSIDERAQHKREDNRRVNDRVMQSKEGKVDSNINSVNDKQPLAEVQLNVQHDTLANEQQYFVQSEPINDTHLLEKVDRNTIPDSTNMCHRGGEIEQNAEKCQVSCPLLDPSFDNMTTKFSTNLSILENMFSKSDSCPTSKKHIKMETHCVNMELKISKSA
ncbi:hypothetical protein Tco_0149571 [Tanacetum coccineum]